MSVSHRRGPAPLSHPPGGLVLHLSPLLPTALLLSPVIDATFGQVGITMETEKLIGSKGIKNRKKKCLGTEGNSVSLGFCVIGVCVCDSWSWRK